jgi:glycosyltransferase involved in cell wall biosynthesis
VKIGFDAKRFFNNFTGLGNYSRFVVDALSRFAPENQYLLYSPKIRDHPEFSEILSRPNIGVVTPPRLYQILRATSLWRTWGISREKNTRDLDVFHGLSQELPVDLPPGVKKVVTVHDLIYMRYPELYQAWDVAIYKAKIKSACRQADRILATSFQTKEDIVKFLAVDADTIDVVYQGCHPNFKKSFTAEQIRVVKTKYKLPQHYILNVGTIEARKNVALLIKALARLPKDTQMHVVIIGRPTAYKQEIIRQAQVLNVVDQVIFLHDVSFEDLPAIYQGARVFVYPSFFEGFGIPIVEALESAVPVIAATGSCLKEAGGPASFYFNPQHDEELAAQLTKVLSDDQLRLQMVLAGKKHAAHFQPDVIAAQLTAIYAQ